MKRKLLKQLVCILGMLFITFPAWSAVPSNLLPEDGSWSQTPVIDDFDGGMLLAKNNSSGGGDSGGHGGSGGNDGGSGGNNGGNGGGDGGGGGDDNGGGNGPGDGSCDGCGDKTRDQLRDQLRDRDGEGDGEGAQIRKLNQEQSRVRAQLQNQAAIQNSNPDGGSGSSQ